MRLVIVQIVASFALIGWSGGQSVWANVFAKNGQDPRQARIRTGEASQNLAPIGIAINDSPVPNKSGYNSIGRATTFMVSPCFALVNYHAAFGDVDIPNPEIEHSMTVHIGVNEKGGFAYKLKAIVVRAGEKRALSEWDWALLKVEKCPGRKTGWIKLAAVDEFHFAGTKVSMAGFPIDKPADSITVQEDCHLMGLNAGTGNLEHDCASRSGSSGSPLFLMIDGTPTAIAMHVGTDKDRPEILQQWNPIDTNQAIPMWFLKTRKEVFQLILDDIALWNNRNPASHLE